MSYLNPNDFINGINMAIQQMKDEGVYHDKITLEEIAQFAGTRIRINIIPEKKDTNEL